MEIKDFEFSPPQAEEFPAAPPDAEFSTPPPEQEFTPPIAESFSVPVSAARSRRDRRRQRYLLFASAALLYTGVLAGGVKTRVPPSPAAPAAVVSASPLPSAPAADPTPAGAEPTPVAAASPTPAAEETPTPVEEATPAPEKTEVRAIFMSFSDTLEGAVYFYGRENILKAYAQIWDPQIEQAVGGFDISHDAIEEGYFKLPTIYVYDLYEQHMAEYEAAGNVWPDPELQIIYLFINENGDEEEQTTTVPNQYELGWAARYWEPDADPEWAYPGCFAFSTYESTAPVNVTYSREDPAVPGAITVWLTVNGRDVPADMVRVETREDAFDFDDGAVTYYYGNLVIPRPDWAGEHGVAHFTVREYLQGYDEIWITETDVEY